MGCGAYIMFVAVVLLPLPPFCAIVGLGRFVRSAVKEEKEGIAVEGTKPDSIAVTILPSGDDEMGSSNDEDNEAAEEDRAAIVLLLLVEGFDPLLSVDAEKLEDADEEFSPS